ncbi:MAG: hypothetical protein ACRDFA_03965, partial [bacterium]
MISRRCLATAVVLLVVAAMAVPASATYRYVSPAGNDANSGSSPTNAWATIGRANAAALPGDVIFVANGTYAHFPSPAMSGTATQRIAFVGNLASPSSVVITDSRTNFTKSHVTLKGFHLANGFTLSGVRDSIAHCWVGGSKPQILGADDCVVTHCRVEAERFWIQGVEADTFPKAERDTIRLCTFNLRPTSTGHTMRLNAVEDCVVDRCRFTIDIAPSAWGASPVKMFGVKRSRFMDSFWNATNRCGSCDEAGWFVLRDHTQSNAFVRDTILLQGAAVQFFATCSGTYPGSVMNNNFESCVIKQSGASAYGAAVFYQDAAQWDTLRSCVIVGEQGGLAFNSRVHGPMLIEANTVVAFQPPRGTLSVEPEAWTGVTTLRSNIFYSAESAPRVSGSAPLFSTLSSIG